VFSVQPVSRVIERAKKIVEGSWVSRRQPACQDMSLGAEKKNWGTEASELLSAVQWSWKSSCEQKSLCVP
jgi:predicted nucleic acid-binding Zn ribbon protein